MRWLLYLILGLTVGCGPHEQPPGVDVMTSLWMHLDSDWRSPPGAPQDEKTAYARLLCFAPDGEFSGVACIIGRTKDSSYISRGDGQTVFLGHWQWQGAAIVATYRLSYEMVPPVGGGRYPGPEFREELKPARNGLGGNASDARSARMLVAGRQFVREKGIQRDDYLSYVQIAKAFLEKRRR